MRARFRFDTTLYIVYNIHMSGIENVPLRDQVHEILTERILSWHYPPKTNLKDTVIAEELEVSRTPVREALLQLAQDGLVDPRQGRGFTVRPLRREEIEETYPILWTLESLALSLACPLDAEVLSKLELLNDRLEKERESPKRRLEIDFSWHTALISKCPNHRLRNLISNLRKIVRRHEFLYMQEVNRVTESLAYHGKITSVLLQGETEAGRKLLEEHWKTSLELRLALPEEAGEE